MDIRAVGSINTTANVDTNKTKASDGSFEKHLENAVNKNDSEQLKKVCKDFEGILLNMMYKQMKASVPKSDLIPGDIGTDVFESMLDEQLMGEASKGNGVGLADVLYKQLSRQTANLTGKKENDADITK